MELGQDLLRELLPDRFLAHVDLDLDLIFHLHLELLGLLLATVQAKQLRDLVVFGTGVPCPDALEGIPEQFPVALGKLQLHAR